MNDLTPQQAGEALPALIDRAATALASARSSAEVLEARALAGAAYDAAKHAARIAKAKGAYDEVIGAVYRAQADALLIEARAKMRLADEYDAAQERGEVATREVNPGSVGHVGDHNMPPATAADLGLRRDEIHEARKLRDAERAEPGRVERAVKAMVDSGEEPTKAKLRREVIAEAAPAEETADPHAADRPALRKLTREGLEDEVIGLRAENAELRAALAEEKAKRKALKARLADLTADDKDEVIRRLTKQVEHHRGQQFKASEEARIAVRMRRKAEDARDEALRRLGEQVIPLDYA